VVLDIHNPEDRVERKRKSEEVYEELKKKGWIADLTEGFLYETVGRFHHPIHQMNN
jgi:hypothetical protein